MYSMQMVFINESKIKIQQNKQPILQQPILQQTQTNLLQTKYFSRFNMLANLSNVPNKCSSCR
jgi:hypothetical protein